jgi:hypothetical protein
MKKINLFTIALSAFMISLTSCSSDDVIDSETPVENNEVIGQDAYLAMNLKMATSAATRAGEDQPSYADGKAEEYEIKTATLYLFEGDADADANYSVFKKKYEIATGDLNTINASLTNITNGGGVVVELKNLAYNSAKKYYALVLVNKSSATFTEPTAGQTFAAWNKTAVDVSSSKMYNVASGAYSNFYMANSLLCTTLGSSTTVENVTTTTPGEIESLVDVTACLQDTREKAYTQLAKTDNTMANPATIYVERGVAKISFTEATGKTFWGENGQAFSSDEGSTYSGSIKFLGWFVDNTDTQSYMVHTLGYKLNGETAAWGIDALGEASDEYNQIWNAKGGHFIGTADKRVYWAFTPRYGGGTTDESGNYNNRTEYDATTDAFNEAVYKSSSSDEVYNSGNPYVYVPENCQDYSKMTKGTNTRVIFKAQYTPAGATAGDDVYMVGTTAYTKTTLDAAIKDTGSDEAYLTIDDFDIDKLNKDGQFSTDALIESKKDLYTDADMTAVNNTLGVNKSYKPFTYFKGGICYYTTYVRHISDDCVDWSSGAYTLAHLGRYGVVRNNWYDFQITQVLKPGKPNVPDLPDKPGTDDPQTDDEEYFIKVNVRILSWVKHATTVDNLE